jgi:hypothetical protein
MRSAREKLTALRKAETNGDVSDSMKVRKMLTARVRSGELMLEEAQLELDIIKRNGKFLGKMTRRQFFE